MTCTYPDCSKPEKARGWCTGHYRQWLRAGGDPKALRPLRHYGDGPTECSGPGCRRPVLAVGLCKTHYAQIRRLGDRSTLTPIRRVRPPRRDTRINRAARRIEDALWLLDCGTHAAEVAHRVGYPSVPAMEVALRRAGHPRPEVMRESKYARTAA